MMSLKVVHLESMLAVLALWADFLGIGEYISDLVGVFSNLATDIFEAEEDNLEAGECIFLDAGEDNQEAGEGISS